MNIPGWNVAHAKDGWGVEFNSPEGPGFRIGGMSSEIMAVRFLAEYMTAMVRPREEDEATKLLRQYAPGGKPQ